MKTIKDLEKEEDIMAIFNDIEILLQYIETNQEFLDAFTQFLDDEQKLEVIRKDYFKRQSTYLKRDAIMSIKDNSIKKEIMQDISIIEDTFNKWNLIEFIETMDDEDKLQVLNNRGLLEKVKIELFDIKNIIVSIQDDEIKSMYVEKYDFNSYQKLDIYKAFGEENKKRIILDDEKSFKKYEIIQLINSLSIVGKVDFLKTEKVFLEIKNLQMYDIVK